MSSSKSRQRALARAKVERQIARRAAAARRRRQWTAGIGSAVLLIGAVIFGVWATGGFERDPAASDDCAWTTEQKTPETKDVGLPPKRGIQKSGTKTMQITTNQGAITAVLDLAKAPCTAASFTHLASKQFFDNSKCHRLTTEGIFVLQCGDPSGTGRGGPTYRFGEENLPTAPQPDPSTSAAPTVNLYPKGTLAMANTGSPGTSGSQFFIVYNDNSALEGKYTIFGTVTAGLDVVEKVAAGGATGQDGQAAGDGTPKIETVVQTLTIAEGGNPPATPGPTSPAPATPAPTTPAPTATPSTNS